MDKEFIDRSARALLAKYRDQQQAESAREARRTAWLQQKLAEIIVARTDHGNPAGVDMLREVCEQYQNLD